MSGDKVLFNVFPKSGTGLLHALRGITSHVRMFDERGYFRSDNEYLTDILSAGVCTGHIPYSDYIRDQLKREKFRTVFIFRNLRDVVVSLVNYVAHKEASELNVMAGGKRLSRNNDPIAAAIPVVADWWVLFRGWMEHADAVYTYRELRGAALLLGRELTSETFLHGNINGWRRVFQPHHIAAAKVLPDLMKEYNLAGCYGCND